MSINVTIPTPSLPSSWQPKLAGLITAAAAFVMTHPEDFVRHPWVSHLAVYVLSGGLAVLGFTTKQVNVTGGTVANSSGDPKVVAATAVPKQPEVK